MDKILKLSFAILLILGCGTGAERTSQSYEARQPSTKDIRLNWEKDSIGRFSILSLIDTGLSISPGNYSVKLSTKRAFKNDFLNVSVYSNIDRQGWGKIDSITFLHDQKLHKLQHLNLPFFSPSFLISVREGKGINLRFDDFNFDGQPDIAIFNSEASGVKNIAEDIYIYDKKREGYFFHKLLSQSSNVSADPVTKTLSTFSQGGMASQIFGTTTYEWMDQELVETKSVNQKYHDSLDVFIRTETELMDGVWILTVDTLSDDELER